MNKNEWFVYKFKYLGENLKIGPMYWKKGIIVLQQYWLFIYVRTLF